MVTLGEKIRIARHENGYTQARLSELMSVSHVTINRWENDKSVPSSDDLIKLSKILDADFTAEDNDETQYVHRDDRNLQLEEIRLELAAAKAGKKKMIIVMIVAIIIAILTTSLVFLSILLHLQKFDPDKDDYPIKIVEYYYEDSNSSSLSCTVGLYWNP